MNGQVSHTAGTLFGQRTTYSCNTGYTLVGSNTRTCQADGMWSGNEPTCISESNLTIHMWPVMTLYTCARSNFYESDIIHSLVVSCDALTDPANGQVSHSNITTFGQTATYSCDTGYNLVGSSTRTCQADGMWSENAPTCNSESNLTVHL